MDAQLPDRSGAFLALRDLEGRSGLLKVGKALRKRKSVTNFGNKGTLARNLKEKRFKV